jgi:hypothetical protein
MPMGSASAQKVEPGRVFLDSCVLQLLSTYGEFIHDGARLRPRDRIRRIPCGLKDLQSLRNLSMVCQRSSLCWVISEASLEEAVGKRDSFHFGWVSEMEEYSGWCLRSYAPSTPNREIACLGGVQFGYLARGDRLLLGDAVRLGCDAFLTTYRRLARNASHIHRSIGIHILTPPEYWEALRPWIGLLY